MSDNENKFWYCIVVQSNFENKAKQILETRLKDRQMDDLVEEIFIPTERVLDNKVGGGKKFKDKRLFPGYIFINCEMTDNLFLLLKNEIPRVKNITVDSHNKPVHIKDSEIEKMKAMSKASEEDPRHNTPFEVGDRVEILDGSFKGFAGHINSIEHSKKTAKILVTIFGRETPIDMDFKNLEKVS